MVVPNEPQKEIQQEICKFCGGTGVGGYVSHEMALDAGEPQMEGQPVTCGFCGGDGWRILMPNEPQQTDIVTEARELLRTPMEIHEFARGASELLRQLADEVERLRAFVSSAAEQGCLRSRRVHCAENEPNSADWCLPCQAKFLTSEGCREKEQRA